MKEEIQRLIDDLDDARACGVVYTYGSVQDRLRTIIKDGA